MDQITEAVVNEQPTQPDETTTTSVLSSDQNVQEPKVDFQTFRNELTILRKNQALQQEHWNSHKPQCKGCGHCGKKGEGMRRCAA